MAEKNLINQLELEQNAFDSMRFGELQRAIEQASIISITDLKGNIIYVNDNFVRISGYSREELLGSTHRIISSGYHSKFFWNEMWRTVALGEIFRSEVKNKAKDGSYYWVDTFIIPIRNEYGKISQYLSVRNDITDKKRLLQDYAVELNKELAVQTRSLQDTIQELESFSYSISHDLRAPLRLINGYAKILEDDHGDMLGKEGKDVIHVITKNTLRMGNLIDDLLLFSRLGRVAVSVNKTDMTRLVKEVLEEVSLQWTNNSRFAKVTINDLDAANVDVKLIKQVWVNLIDNAFKYSSKKEYTEIAIHSSRHHGFIYYCVEDNGVGFDMKYSDKLFGVFQRLHRMDEFDGTGVGLALVRRLVTKHGGRVWAESVPDKGSRFYFSIPT